MPSEDKCRSASTSPRRGLGPVAGAGAKQSLSRGTPVSAALPLPCTCGRCATVVRIPLFPQRCRCRQRRVPGSGGAESLRGPAVALLGGSAVEPGMCGQRRPVETGAWPCCSGPTGSWPRGHALLTPRERQRVRDQISGGTCESCLTQAIGTPDWPSLVVRVAASALGLVAAVGAGYWRSCCRERWARWTAARTVPAAGAGGFPPAFQQICVQSQPQPPEAPLPAPGTFLRCQRLQGPHRAWA